ncbi:MAG: hypothetical protein ACLGSD_16470 [Acidobacteriota bacterium]
MPRVIRCLVLAFASLFVAQFVPAQSTVIFNEPGFPTVDTGAVSPAAIARGLKDGRAVNAAQLPGALVDARTTLLVLPYGSAYPEAAWPAILKYLDRGGNLMVLGGKPFTRAAYRDGAEWKLRQPDVAESLELFIHDYQETPGSNELQFAANPDIHAEIAPFAWKRGFSPVVRLSVTDRVPRDMGGTGNEDAWLTTIAWGERDGHKLAAPAFLIDHVGERFTGGRWIFLACDGASGAFENPKLLAALQTLALRRNDRFTLRPKMAVFAPGEKLEFEFAQGDHAAAQNADELRITTHADEGQSQSFTFPAGAVITLPQAAAQGRGLHTVEASLIRGGKAVWTYRTGFWMRDLAYLRGGPKLTVGPDYFELDGKPLPVVGTTYMSSDVDRMYLAEPNPYVWDEDMKQIRGAGLNMLRSGIWTQWKLLVNPDDTMSEHTLRSIEAFLMTARRNGLPVQFNLFAFVPDAFGGGHPYLGAEARARQDRYVHSVVSRFHGVPYLAWDLINEPSANENAWHTVPQPNEDAAWRAWLKKRYPDQAALLAAWSEPSFGKGRALQAKPTAIAPEVKAQDPFALPAWGAFAADSVRSGYNPLKVYDYQLFTQSFFRDWVKHQAQTIRTAGSQQLITVGQDEGGVAGRLSPAFFSPDVSFTCTHAWWDFDSVLWAGLMAKMPGEPMLIQEMGEQRRLTMNDHLRLSADEEAWQLERKLAISFAQGAGGIEWVWNVNAMMANDNEIPIGAVRPDGTEKPEVPVLSGMARFAAQHRESFTGMEPPAITVIASQAELYGQWDLATNMLKKSVRALAYYDHQPLRMLPENRIAELGQPKLVILPGAEALTQKAWEQLLAYVDAGGHLLITGPVEYDEHWQPVDRLSALGVHAQTVTLDVRRSSMAIPGEATPVAISYPSEVQTAPTDILRFADGAGVETIRRGKGMILWASDPVELAEGYEAAARVYSYAMTQVGIAPAFRQIKPLSPGVLAFATVLKDAVLYSFSSEQFAPEQIDIEDAVTHGRIQFTLPAQRGAVVLLDRETGKTLAEYEPGSH